MVHSERQRAPRATATAAAALVVCAALTAAGCDADAPATAVAATKPSPVPGGVLRMVQEAPLSLDPADASSVYESLPINQIFDSLVVLDASQGIVPGLASEWFVTRDGLTYEFQLRPDVRFHDGVTLTSADVAFTIRRLLAGGSASMSSVVPYLSVVRGADAFRLGQTDHLAGVEVVDDLTLRLHLEHAYPSFLEVLTLDGLKIVPAHVLRDGDADAFRSTPVGTGPFRLQGVTDDGMVLVANEDYHGGRPHLDRFEIGFLGADEVDSGAARYFARDLDVIEPNTADLERLAEDPGTRMFRYQELGLSFLGFSTSVPPLDRLEIRQAVAHAIDRARLVSDSPVVRREARGILPPGMAAYSPDVKTLAHDPDRARELVRQAGFSAANPLPPLELYTSSHSPAAMRTLARIVEDIEAVGIPVEVRDVGWAELHERIENGGAAAFLLAWLADMTDPDAFLRGLVNTDGQPNHFGYEDEQSVRLLEQGFRELNPTMRTEIYRRLERRILGRAPVVPLYHTMGVVAVGSDVHGVEPGPMGLSHVAFERVWIDPGPGGPS